jgi:flagellar biosynthesis protein FlhF
MKIKKVVARDMQVALHMLRKELGDDAVIVSSRTVREPGLLGFFRPRKVEVTAASDRSYERTMPAAESLRDELGEIRSLLSRLGVDRMSTRAGAQGKWSERLRAADVGDEVSSLLLDQVSALVSEEEQEKQILERLAKFFPIMPKARVRQKRIMAFVGPTGVGKTTTIAKLAARWALQDKKKIALVTIDTFRIGAVEQLRIYGEIIGVPVEVVTSPAELQHVLARHKNKDTIFIDTTGRSAKRPMQLAELRAFLDPVKNLEKYLVVSATIKARDLLTIYRAYSSIGLTAAIFTKLDETDSLGPLLDLCHRTSLPVAYVANGQNVPEDLEEADSTALARLLWGGEE